MAARLGVDHQQLQQSLTSSTWDVLGVRRRVASTAVDLVAPVTLDQAGKKKPHVRKQVPPEEQIAQILHRRAASLVFHGSRYRRRHDGPN